MLTKLRKKLRDTKIKGALQGEIKATLQYQKNMDFITSEHEKRIHELVKSHRVEIRVIEKEFILKQVRLEKKMKRLDDLVGEWEENIYQVKEISSQAREVLARVKQVLYQDRKTLANALDDEKTIEMLQMSLNNLVQKQGSAPHNSSLF